MRHAPALLSVILLCNACSAEETSPETNETRTLTPPEEGEGIQFSFEHTVPPGEEVWICKVYPIPTDDFSYINNVTSISNPGMHHMTLSTMGFTGPKFEYGVHDCADILLETMSDQIMIFGNQGGATDLVLPEGIAATIPPGIDMIHELHYVNTTEEPVDIYSYINGYNIPQDEVTDGIWGSQIRDENLSVPEGEEVTEWTRCVMNEPVDILFLGSHTHSMGVEFTVARFDGENTSEVFYTNTDWHDPKIEQFAEPLHLEAGEGFEFHCTWRNTSEKDIAYGLTAEDEMCNLTIVHTPYSTSARCEVVESSDGVLWAP